MAEQNEPAEQEPTQEESGGVDWKKRYEDLRPQYDRIQNEYSQLQDPDYRSQLFTELAEEQGYVIDPGEDYEDSPQYLTRAELDAALAERDQAYANREAIQYAQNYAATRLNELKVKNEKIRDWIETKATNMPALQDEEGRIIPDIDAAYEDWQEAVNEAKSEWASGKAGAVGATEGQANTGAPNWRNIEDPYERKLARDAWAVEQVQLRLQGS